MPKLVKSEYQKQTEEYESAFLVAMATRRLRQVDLAKKLKTHQPIISKRLSNLDNVKLKDLRSMAKELGLRITIGE